jgi:hypothetical protein
MDLIMDNDSAIKEHIRLIRRLKTRKDLDEELKEQENDLKQLKRFKEKQNA